MKKGIQGSVLVVVNLSHGSVGRDPCCCCGKRYPVKKLEIRWREGKSFHGSVCPECVLMGPGGAARRIRERLAGDARGGSGLRLKKGAGGAGTWHGLMRERAAALEGMEAFPLSARQAAAREMRERR